MKIFVADAGTERPGGSTVEEPWAAVGAADDSTLPSDLGVIRLQMHDTTGSEVLPMDKASAYIPDLGVYETDVTVELDDSGVLSISANRAG